MLTRLLSSSCILFCILLPIILLVNFDGLFHWQFSRYNIYSHFEISATAVDEKFSQVLHTLRPKFRLEMDPVFFSAEDILHMYDVQQLMVILYSIWLMSGLLIVTGFVMWKSRSQLPWVVLLAHQFNHVSTAFKKLILIAIPFIILVAWQWQQAFVTFHKIFFPFNNYWQLDPHTSNLIKFLPEQIFQELGLIYLVLVLAEFLLILTVNHYLHGWLSQIPNSHSSRTKPSDGTSVRNP